MSKLKSYYRQLSPTQARLLRNMFYKHLRQSEGTFYLLMRAKVEPSITQLQFFAKAFGVEMEALIEEPIKIRSLVEEEAMSQKEFAEKLGLSK